MLSWRYWYVLHADVAALSLHPRASIVCSSHHVCLSRTMEALVTVCCFEELEATVPLVNNMPKLSAPPPGCRSTFSGEVTASSSGCKPACTIVQLIMPLLALPQPG